MKRKVSIHDAKRALMRRMNRLGAYEVERICLEFREYAIARRFLNGRPVAFLVTDHDCGGGAWDTIRVEQAIRNKTRKPR